MSAQIDPGREDELPDGNSGQQPTALSARCRCAGRVVPGASRRPRVTSTPNGVRSSGRPPAALELLDGLGAEHSYAVSLPCRAESLARSYCTSLDGMARKSKCGSACRTRRRIAELISDADDLLAGFDSLPVTLAHHDPQWGNLSQRLQTSRRHERSRSTGGSSGSPPLAQTWVCISGRTS